MRVLAALLGVTALASAGVTWAQTAPPSSAPAPQGIQQAFEAATALGEAGKWEEALAAYRALEPRVGTARSKALVQLRQSRALIALGRTDEVRPILTAALATLPESDASLREDRTYALLSLAAIDSDALDYSSAYAGYRAALRFADADSDKAGALIGLIQTGTFVDPEGALAHVAEAQALVATPGFDDRSRALVEMPISQLYLNLGRYKEAKEVALGAVKHLGGMTDKIDPLDAAARSDVALAALKLDDQEMAREYLASAGAGRSEQGFSRATQMQTPPCGGEMGIRPDDMAVVEFWLGTDGTVVRAVPIYATRPGQIGIAFAQSVQDWSWLPEDLAKLPAFFRYRVRVELRCSEAFPRPAVTDSVRAGLVDWLEEQHVSLPSSDNAGDARRLPGDRAALAVADSKGLSSGLAAIPLLHALVSNSVMPAAERVNYAERELAILLANKAPPLARLEVEWRLWSARASGKRGNAYVRDLEAAIQAPHHASDPLARSALRLMLADSYPSLDRRRAGPLLHAVVDDAAVESLHPFKVGALIRLASIEKAGGNLVAARAAFDQTGLNAEQCAMLDAPPKMKSSAVQNDAFPMEAWRWGFEGWVAMQFDIDANGHTGSRRALISYPPFVFNEAAAKLVGTVRFTATYRPGGTPGCGAFTSPVIYRMPH